MSEKIILTAVIKAKPGKEKILKEKLQALVAPTHAQDGCIQYQFHEAVDDSTRFMCHEIWRDQTAFENHVNSEFLQNFLKTAEKELLAAPVELTFWQKI